MYSVDWSLVLNYILHPLLRSEFNLKFLNAVATPFKTIYNLFSNYKSEVDYKLKHTSQVWSIRAVLNDAFDIADRSITLTDAGGSAVILLDLDSFESPIILDLNSYPPAVLIENDSGYEGSTFDFVVTVPFAISESQLYRLKALVNYYRLAGKRYDVNIDGGLTEADYELN